MLKKFAISAVAATTLATALPVTSLQAQPYGYYNGGRYEQSYRNGYYQDRYGRYQRDSRYYQNGRYYGDSRYYRNGNRCSGSTGTIIGAIAGGLLGDAAVGRRGDDTMGAIVGAGVGALAGRAIDKSDCRR